MMNYKLEKEILELRSTLNELSLSLIEGSQLDSNIIRISEELDLKILEYLNIVIQTN
jgi:hypothetical protein